MATAATAATTTYDSQAQRDPRLANDARRRLTLIDELPTLPVSGSSFEYNALNAYANAADEQSNEGVAKAEANLPTELKTAPIATVAHFLIASEQVLDDTPALAQQIQSLLTYGISAKLEALLVGGSGIIEGLETLGTSFTASSGLGIVDAISEAEAALDSAGWRASHVLLNPTTGIKSEVSAAAPAANMLQAAGTTGPTEYLEPEGNCNAKCHQRPAGCARCNQVAILDRQSATFEAFRQDSDHVRKNLVTLRSRNEGWPSRVRTVGCEACQHRYRYRAPRPIQSAVWLVLLARPGLTTLTRCAPVSRPSTGFIWGRAPAEYSHAQAVFDRIPHLC